MDLEYRRIRAQAKDLSVFINSFAGKNEILYRTFYTTETRAFQQVFWTYEALMSEAMGWVGRLDRRLKGSSQLAVRTFNGNMEQNGDYSGISFCFQVPFRYLYNHLKTSFLPAFLSCQLHAQAAAGAICAQSRGKQQCTEVWRRWSKVPRNHCRWFTWSQSI